MKIFYQYAKYKTLTPKRGDLINELGTLKALSLFADVYYSGQKFSVNSTNYGLREYYGKVDRFLNNADYDLYIVRNNVELFKKIGNKPKIWVASPYDLECFRSATAIAAFTKSWEDMLRKAVKFPGLNPDAKGFYNVITLYQTIDEIFKPLQDEVKTRSIRSSFNSDFVIGYFGRITESTYPLVLLSAWGEIVKKYPGIKMVVSTTTGSFPKGIPNTIYASVPFHEMPYYLSACDLVIISQHGIEWDICGNLKVKEPAACGVPVILEKSNARCEEYGDDYQLFLPRDSFDLPVTDEKKRELLAKLELIYRDKELRAKIGSQLVEKMKFYSIEVSSKRLNEQLSSLIGKQ